MRIVAMNHVSLDGVMQGPGRAGEDERGGFVDSGWATERAGDEVVGRVLGERLAECRGWLFGRRTYDDVLTHWNSVPDSPFAESLNAATKYVATTHPDDPLIWPNSVAIPSSSIDSSEVPDAVSALRERDDGVLGVMGSSVLLHALQARHLVDEYLLMVHPLVLGRGIRLFADGGPPASLELVRPAETSGTGVVIAIYQPEAAPLDY
jgi:dihydrofolate reductase